MVATILVGRRITHSPFGTVGELLTSVNEADPSTYLYVNLPEVFLLFHFRQHHPHYPQFTVADNEYPYVTFID